MKKSKSLVKPKKNLGQHFLKSSDVAKKIVDCLNTKNISSILEIGPGMGILTEHIINLSKKSYFIEIDKESATYLKEKFKQIEDNIVEKDFLKIDLKNFKSPIGVIGNFPYNISSQIIFKVIDNRNLVDKVVGMFQLEVAKRICENPGTKSYGIISVLVQAFYETKFEFMLEPEYFNPPPKVDSGVISLKRRKEKSLNCNENLFFKIVKLSFQQRRKTLRNSLKIFNLSNNIKEDVIFDKRPETLSVKDFVHLTNIIANENISA
ncbi:MAG: 16S rRNA (adenine(1518)-N(6)/adenine(1519)-N(6))-dimethyltransferase RsmA [Flavobacteriaceae bacterium]|nr:16S rRNA (adenine(1518)-N(6)/adenine(1519)-N(6))-dimethyltransferase RsmA [Flavobacteriaceae bacterium]